MANALELFYKVALEFLGNIHRGLAVTEVVCHGALVLCHVQDVDIPVIGITGHPGRKISPAHSSSQAPCSQ